MDTFKINPVFYRISNLKSLNSISAASIYFNKKTKNINIIIMTKLSSAYTILYFLKIIKMIVMLFY